MRIARLAATAAPALLLELVDATAALLLLADLAVVSLSVFYRYVLAAPIEWSDDVARGLMVALSFFGAAGALARDENVGVAFFVRKLPPRWSERVAAATALVVLATAGSVAWNAIALGRFTTGQTTGSGLPLELTFYPMGAGAVCMTIFALARFCRRRFTDIVFAFAVALVFAAAGLAWHAAASGGARSGAPMFAAFVACLVGGAPIGFALAFTALVYIWLEGTLPGLIFAQQMARGIDNFVLLAIPFFILVGYLMDANGMSVRLIALLERLVGRVRGGLNVVMVLSMVIFSGISGSKMADVAAVGSVLIPAARRSGRNPGGAVALLAASAVMAETIPPCINLIILGFVANLSIGGLFIAGLAPAGLMALALIGVVVLLGGGGSPAPVDFEVANTSLARLWSGAIVTLGLLVIIFVGFRMGVATATEISAFAALYALGVGGVAFRELGRRAAARSFVQAATRSGLVLFIVAAAQSLAFVLTLQQVPHEFAQGMIALSQHAGAWLFMLLSILILIVMGSVLEGAAALIIFGPLLVPVAGQIGINGLHFGVVLVVAMGIGLFAPPLGLGLYGACLIGGVPIEATVKPMLGYLGLLFLCLLLIAFVPGLTLWLPGVLGYG